MAIATVNPATGETVKTFTPHSPREIEAKLSLAASSFAQYRLTPLHQRSEWLNQAASILEAEAPQLARLMTLEMGKPIKSAIAEVQKCALVCRYYAENGPGFLADEPIETDAKLSYLRYEPMGIILAVMPWNFPFWQVFRFAAPILMGGNVGLLKHASNVPQCSLEIERVIRDAGFPPGVFQSLLIGGNQVEAIINDPRVKAATLTGSEPAGMSLASAAGKQIKKTVLELGGSDPFIVLESANLEAAVATAVTARMLNSGQSCVAAKRFIIQASMADAFEAKLLAKFQALKVGDPQLEETEVGPLATPGIRDDLDLQVQKTVAMGGKVLIGGKPMSDRPGYFYPPTIITEIPPDSPGAQEEFFGPVALLFRVNDLSEAIALANDTVFGLGASAWTNNPQEQERLIQEIEAGCVFINGLVKSDPRLPFGGIKRSGYGRELGKEGMREFVNIKTVWIAHDTQS
ncbi:NAD-dependent succinate-semialdehyde dehydrogenase [Gloeocapsa sp. PCC 73106]|uniref:NAD-dependent succinate-semialdehyde dehydrogenase n=1 Tax=Gloeocapsa sp. PCC 73106 TaxID=102232 RepID=UPI0002AC0CEB|nr:NAD-dependent succinate-semialdehyde dehydrogenase [Gloeocapsa sp. PCC 73106]ELS00179.1 NAD-dependent aldehyde dehydrogenase [Gloeocapsa sp. PCC 73106]